MTQGERDQRRPEGADAETAEQNADIQKESPEKGYPAGETEPYGDEPASHEHPEDVGGPTPERTQSGDGCE